MSDLRLRRPLHLFAPAKVNLGLEVLGRRGDGYHEILTIMQTVSLFDQIVLTPSERFEFRGDARIQQETDLAYRAVVLFQQQTGIDVRARIRVTKRIPLSGGLGGGSSDAGTLLSALCNLSRTPSELEFELAAALGSDVPFFLNGGTALASGTGTTIDRLPDLPRIWLVIVTPEVSTENKTASAYKSLVPGDFSDGAVLLNVASAMRGGESVSWKTLPAAFAGTVFDHPEAASARDELRAAGAAFVLPSGAGPSLFTVVDSWRAARDLETRLRQRGRNCVACTTIGPNLNAQRIARSRVE